MLYNIKNLEAQHPCYTLLDQIKTVFSNVQIYTHITPVFSVTWSS